MHLGSEWSWFGHDRGEAADGVVNVRGGWRGHVAESNVWGAAVGGVVIVPGGEGDAVRQCGGRELPAIQMSGQ